MTHGILFSGSGVALVTPFENSNNNNNPVNFKELERLIEWHIASKTDALIVCGTTGEASTLSESEKKAIFTFTVEMANGRIDRKSVV